jgi:DNA mismatch endonuclease (patch repair protein)
MPDDRTSAQRSETMRRVRSRDTGPEIALRRALHAAGLRYSLRRRLAGSPDVVFVRARVAVFVDGCFWHGCRRHCRRPATNRPYWAAKIERNLARDARVGRELRAAGWRVVRLWEHQVRADPARCAARVKRLVRGRTPAPGRTIRP